jgi:hypothetical protein
MTDESCEPSVVEVARAYMAAFTRKRWVFALVLLGGIGLCRATYFHLFAESPHQAAWPRIDSRYSDLRAMLPANGIVGYISDQPVGIRPGGETFPGTRLFLDAQYALAPLVLRYDDDRSAVVIADLADPRKLPDLLKGRRLSLVAEPHPGVALLRPSRP